MKLASLKSARKHGRLIVVSRDQTLAADASMIAPDLLSALECWDTRQPELEEIYNRLNDGTFIGAFAFDPAQCAAPLPCAPQWLDASAFLNHGYLMERAFNTERIPHFETIPVMYQGASDDFHGPMDDMVMASEEYGIDFEGEFGVVVGAIPMGCSPEAAEQQIRLIVQVNDWSLRALGPHEMKTGFGFLQAKPSSSFAPLAVTPDELGDAWANGRVNMHLKVEWNGARFGEPHGREMHYSFGELIAHAARTRTLSAGSVVGSGTVSNQSRAAGSACIAERRVIEIIDEGAAKTPFMQFGDRVRMQAMFDNGDAGPFGVIDQRVVALTKD